MSPRGLGFPWPAESRTKHVDLRVGEGRVSWKSSGWEVPWAMGGAIAVAGAPRSLSDPPPGVVALVQTAVMTAGHSALSPSPSCPCPCPAGSRVKGQPVVSSLLCPGTHSSVWNGCLMDETHGACSFNNGRRPLRPGYAGLGPSAWPAVSPSVPTPGGRRLPSSSSFHRPQGWALRG